MICAGLIFVYPTRLRQQGPLADASVAPMASLWRGGQPFAKHEPTQADPLSTAHRWLGGHFRPWREEGCLSAHATRPAERPAGRSALSTVLFGEGAGSLRTVTARSKWAFSVKAVRTCPGGCTDTKTLVYQHDALQSPGAQRLKRSRAIAPKVLPGRLPMPLWHLFPRASAENR